MKSINLTIAIVNLIILVFVLYGGFGALMGFGAYGESLIRDFSWLKPIWSTIWIIWLIVWCVGILISVIKAPELWERIKKRNNEKWLYTDILLALGHAAIIATFILIFSSWPMSDFSYLSLIIAGFIYSSGVGIFALTSRPRSTPQSGATGL